MAPQVTVFFYKLPATAAHPNRTGHRMTFVIGHISVTWAKAKLEAKQDKLGMSTGKTQTFKAASKNALRKIAQSKPDKEEVKTRLQSHIMVGAMRVNLPNVETVMVTSTKGGDEYEPRLPLQGSQSSTMSSQSTAAS
ncbi:hypothetical protein ACLB2K_037942 [Fragaria x ananassa]